MPNLSVFLPWSLFGLLEDAAGGRPASRRVRGAVLFCDVAGFTPLTEALTVLGREGSEELTRLLNGYFTHMIDIIEEEGGDVLRFGGDAMTVLFPGDAAGQAARAAGRMMDEMDRFENLQTRAGTFGLSMKIGAAFGEVFLGILGNEAVGYDYYATGRPLDQAAEAEHLAWPGRVVCHPSFLRNGPSGLPVVPMEGEFGFLSGSVEASAPLTFGTQAPDSATLRRIVPSHLAERAGTGNLGEHRRTAVAFLVFGRSREEAGETWDHEALQGVYLSLAGAARQYGGIVNKIDMGDKGSKAILLFGSPYAIERKEEMAVRAALDLLSKGGLPGEIRARIGLTSSPLFTGPVGSPIRREFTVMGDGINLAARLMQAAPEGDILCDEVCAREAAQAIGFVSLPPVRVKGKREPVNVFRPEGEREGEVLARSRLLDRDSHCELLRRYLFRGDGRPPVLTAQSGLGKTALMEWARAEARMREIPAAHVRFAPYNRERLYSAWKDPLWAVLGLSKKAPEDRVRSARDEALAEEPPGYRPLLNPLLDLPDEQTPALRNLSPKDRKDLTFAILSRVLEAGGERIFLLDGIQWADPLSLDFLETTLSLEEPPSWRVVASRRPGEDASEAATRLMRTVVLDPLSREAVSGFLDAHHGLRDFSPRVLDWFAKRSGGNPAIASALVKALEDAGLLRERGEGKSVDADRLFSTRFPDTLEGLYLQRVDALGSRERSVLQESSVLGSFVSVDLLGKVSSHPQAELREALAALENEGILEDDTRGARPYMVFCESLLCEALYEAVPFAKKRELHLKILETLEGEGAGEIPKYWPALAHHAEAGGDGERALAYHRLAGRQALEQSDNRTALRHLEPLCGSLAADEETVRDAFSLLDVYGFLGKWEASDALLRRIRPIREGLTLRQRARLCFFEARERWRRQRWEEAEELLTDGLRLYEEAEDMDGMGKSYVNLVGGVYGPTGRMDRARECLEKALALPKGPGQSVWRAMAAMNLGAVNWHTGRPGEAEAAFQNAYREAVRGRLGPQRGMVADNLCGLLGERGRFTEAARWGRKAVAVLEEFAIRGVSLNAQYNLALAHLSSGRASEVRDLLSTVERRARAMGNLQSQGLALQGLALGAVWEGGIDAALDRAARALRIFRELGNGRDYRYTLIIPGNLFGALDAREEAGRFWKRTGARAFLRASTGDHSVNIALARIQAWVGGERLHVDDPDAYLAAAEGSSPEERLERRLWICEALAEAGREREVMDRMPAVREALEIWPYYDARIRVLRLEALCGGGLSAEHRRMALSLLSRSHGGVFGIRLLSFLWGVERNTGRRNSLRRRALRAFYDFHLGSPKWAWERLLAFPEIHSVLAGRR